MKKISVSNVNWSGGMVDAYLIVIDGVLCEEAIVIAPTLHLLEIAKNGVSKNTQKNVASDLCAYFENLQAKGIDWRLVNDNEVSSYLGKTLRLSKGLSDQSIKRNISSIKGFYKTAVDIGILESEIYLSYNYSAAPSLKHQEGVSGKPNFQLFRQYIHKDILKNLLASVKAKSPFIRERDELVLKIGYHCGLRACEITSPLNMNTKAIRKALEEARARKEYGITLPIIGKGHKLRYVDFNPEITTAIRNFIEGRRMALPEGVLICQANGRPLSESHASRVFKSAKESGLPCIKKTISNYKIDNEYMITFESAHKLVFHSLRHTYATNLVKYCYKLSLDPWVYVRDQMGHVKRETTESYIIFEANIHARDLIRTELSIEDENY